MHGYVHEAFEICSSLEVTDEVIKVHGRSISGPLELRQPPQQLLMSAFESFLLLELPSLLGVQLVQVLCGVGQNGYFRSLRGLESWDLVSQSQEAGAQVVPPLPLQEVVVLTAVGVVCV